MISSIKKQVKGAIVLGALLIGSNAFAQLGLTWGEMGPNDIAGRCRSIIVDKTDASGNKLFAAGVSGGVFKSTNGGSTWLPVNDLAPSLIVSCMTQDAAGNILFGTGESFGTSLDGAGSSGFLGTGLYKITANSSTIVQLQNASAFGNINEIAIDGSNTIYMATDAGLFISTDAGATFTEETTSATSTLSPSALDVKVAKNGDVYYSSYAATTSTTGVSYVYYCPSGSTTFSNITPPTITSINRCRIEIAPSPVNANYVYLSVAKFNGDLGAVLVSNDKGTTWSTITIGTAQFDPFAGGGNYSNTIVADPVQADACYLGSFLFYRWVQIPSNSLGQGTWSQIGTPANIPFAIYIHSYVHDVKFNSGNGSMYIATDGGIFKSVSSNSGFLPYNNGFNVSQFYSVAFPIYPRVSQTTSTLVPYAGVAGGALGNSLTYMPGYYNNGPLTSNSFGFSDGFQSDFSRLNPTALFYSEAHGKIFRTNEAGVAPPSTFYDQSYKGAVAGGPGATGFAAENTPMRLWENYSNLDSAIFFNEIITNKFANYSSTKTTFTINNTRPQISSKYDSIIVKAASTKKGYTLVSTTSFSNSNASASTFTVANTRPSAYAKYDSIIIKTSSTKLLAPPANQTITIRPSYSGSTIVSYSVTGNANTTLPTNNLVFLNSSLSDSIRFTFNTVPNDSSVFSFRFKYKYAQSLTILPQYTGTVITSCNVLGEANTSSVNNNTVFVNSSLLDSIRFTFAMPIDSALVTTTIKHRYSAGDVIYLVNKDVSGKTFTTSTTLTAPLLTSSTPTCVVKLPLQHSARLAVGINGKATTDGPSVFVTKRPLDFAINPDWVKIAGKNSRMDGPGGVASTVAAAISTSSATITHLEWAPSGSCLYFSTKLNNSYYLYRVSHLEFLADSAGEDYSGIFSSDVDSASAMRKSALPRTTPIGKFPNPITGISVASNDTMIMVTTGGYTNTAGTVYYSNSGANRLDMNNIDDSNFSIKNGSTLPLIPAYTSLFEMNDNKRALVGTESGVYSTLDITQPSPTWTKESGGNFPNVPVFQLRQQTFPSYKCYNSGVIYAATHGRGIWSTDKFFTPYAIGIEEHQENTDFASGTNIKLYPNPAADATNLLFKTIGDASYKVTVYDINGRVMIQESTGKLPEGTQHLTLNTSALTSGVYFVTVSGTNNFNTNSKLVITH